MLCFLPGISIAGDKEINMTWNKPVLEPDLDGFDLELYIGEGTTLIQSFNVLFAPGVHNYSVDHMVTLPDGHVTEVCARVRARDLSNNHSPWTGWVDSPEDACTDVDFEAPGGCFSLKTTINITP